MRGTIESIEARKAKKGKPYHLVKIDGEAYWVWDAKLIKGISSGDSVDFEYEGDEYPKLTSIKFKGPLPPDETRPKSSGKYSNNPKSMYISYAKDIVVALINSTTAGKEFTIKEIEDTVILMGLAFYQASENGVVEEKTSPEEKAPQKPTSEAESRAEPPETGGKGQNDHPRPIGEFPLLFTVIPKQVIDTSLDDVQKLLPKQLTVDQANRILLLLKKKALERDEFILKVAEICQKKE